MTSENDAIEQQQMKLEISDEKLSRWNCVNTISADMIANKAKLIQRDMIHVSEQKKSSVTVTSSDNL